MKACFNIEDCKRAGCVNFNNKKCDLDGLPIYRFVDSMQYYQNSTVCAVRRQINFFKTEILIKDK